MSKSNDCPYVKMTIDGQMQPCCPDQAHCRFPKTVENGQQLAYCLAEAKERQAKERDA